jgi:hypothetical protein
MQTHTHTHALCLCASRIRSHSVWRDVRWPGAPWLWLSAGLGAGPGVAEARRAASIVFFTADLSASPPVARSCRSACSRASSSLSHVYTFSLVCAPCTRAMHARSGVVAAGDQRQGPHSCQHGRPRIPPPMATPCQSYTSLQGGRGIRVNALPCAPARGARRTMSDGVARPAAMPAAPVPRTHACQCAHPQKTMDQPGAHVDTPAEAEAAALRAARKTSIAQCGDRLITWRQIVTRGTTRVVSSVGRMHTTYMSGSLGQLGCLPAYIRLMPVKALPRCGL